MIIIAFVLFVCGMACCLVAMEGASDFMGVPASDKTQRDAFILFIIGLVMIIACILIATPLLT